MPLLTPSATSSAAAGVGFWTVVWLTVLKVDNLPIINKFVSKDKVTGWVSKNKVLSLTLTEATNFAIHGVTNPNGVTMAIGGTFINSIIIFILLPISGWLKKRSARRDFVLEGI